MSPITTAEPRMRPAPPTARPGEKPEPVRAEPARGLRVLVAEDEQTLRESCVSVLSHEGYDVTACGRGDEARELLQRRTFDIVLLDLYMPQVSGIELLRACVERAPETLVIVMTGNPTVSSSVEALRAGAWDYLPKPFTATHLQILCGRARHTLAQAREAAAPVPEEPPLAGSLSDRVVLLGRSPALLQAIELARKVARTDASVFITGESGTGKEMFAQFIHHHSRRAGKPMVAVNCAALPETLLESEMFGHVKGAFTGAVRDKPGLLETANGGTFFLDELTEMSHSTQAKLLRAIQDGVVRRVGSESMDATVDVRFIAATNRDAREAMEGGMLRKDLYYRLGVVPIRLPALRERPDDVPLLAEHFLATYWKRHREAGAPLPRFTPAALRALRHREWRGNVRELQNVMEHVVLLLDPGADIHPDDIPTVDGPEQPAVPEEWPVGGEPIEGDYHSERERVLARFELNYLTWLVERAGANMSRAAKIAGVDRTTLYRLMEKHRLQRDTIIAPAQDEPAPRRGRGE